jgi:hypothetical protein
VALEARRLDKLEEVIRRSNDRQARGIEGLEQSERHSYKQGCRGQGNGNLVCRVSMNEGAGGKQVLQYQRQMLPIH